MKLLSITDAYTEETELTDVSTTVYVRIAIKEKIERLESFENEAFCGQIEILKKVYEGLRK